MKRPQIIDENKYPGQWLALHPKTHQVLGHSRSLKKAKAEAIKQGIDRPLMHGVPKSSGYFVGSGDLLSNA